MNQKSILQRLTEFDLTDQELKQIESDKDLDSQIDLEEKANAISRELLIPGYGKLLKEKQLDIKKWVDSPGADATIKTSANWTIGYKILGLVASIAIVAAIVIQPWQQTTLSQAEKATELKRLALLSYESSGLLSGERGESSINQDFVTMYEQLSADKCGEISKNSQFQEQELWTDLYCAWVNNNDIEYERIKNLIVDKRYPNFNNIPR